jgi:hypothetical protein
VSRQCVCRSRSVRWLSDAYYLKVAACGSAQQALHNITGTLGIYKKNSFKKKPERLLSPGPPLPYPPSPCPAAHARTGPLQPEELGVARRRKN